MTDIGDKSASAAESPEPSHDEQAEIDRLRAEVEQLRSEQASPVRRRRVGWRAPVATILIVLGCVLAPVAVLGVWSANQVSDTSRYIANIEPLIHDPAVQNALTDKVTNEITSHLNVTGLTNQAAALLTDKGLTRVGTLLQSFGPSIASAVNGFIHDQVRKIVSSPQFANTWIQVNTVAHQAVVKALSGQGNGTVKISNGQVVIEPWPVHQHRQAVPGRAGFHGDKQPSGHQSDVPPVLGPATDQGAERLPADQQSQDRATDTVAPADRPGGIPRAEPPARADRSRARIRGLHARARSRLADLPEHLPEQHPQQRAAQ